MTYEIMIVRYSNKKDKATLAASFVVENEDIGLEKLRALEIWDKKYMAELCVGNSLSKLRLYRKIWDDELEKYTVFATTREGENIRV